jgi:predicted permease
VAVAVAEAAPLHPQNSPELEVDAMGSLMQDVRYSLRQLRRSPALSIAAIATLAIGIGATTAIFSVVNGLLLRQPAGISGFDGLVAIYTSDFSGPRYGLSSLHDLHDFESGAPALTGVAGYSITPAVLGDGTGSVPAEMVLGQVVTPNYFEVLRAGTAVGRAFAPGEGLPGERSDLVVLGYEYWHGRYGGDPGVIGATVEVAGAPFTVIGVAEEGFHGLLPALAPAFFVPVGAPGISGPGMERRDSRGLFAVGRLADGVDIEQARMQLEAIAAGLHQQEPVAWTDVRGEPRAVTVIRAREAVVPPQLRGPAFGFAALLMAAVGGVLLISCANIANLLLARATGRRREIGIRLTIGARRGRIVRQMLTESTVLAAFGALLGFLIASSGTAALARFASGLPLPFPIDLEIAPDLRVFGFAAAVTVVAGVLSGLAPALLATRTSLVSSLHREAGGRWRLGLRSALAAGQIAIAMVLLIAGGLLVRSLIEANAVEPGFRPAGLLSVSLALPEQSTSAEQRLNIQKAIAERVSALPGVSSASYASSLPLGAGEGRRSFRAEGYTPAEGEDMEIHSSHAGPGYFRTMGTRLLSGREFDAVDRPGAAPAAIVNEAFVRRYLQGQDPLGKQLVGGGETFSIVGVVEDGKYLSLGEDPRPFVWRAADQWPQAMATIVVRAEAGAEVLVPQIRQALTEIEPRAAITGVAVDGQHLSFALLPQRAGAWLLGLFGAVGLGLAAIGVYGVMAFAATQRTREFGIRLALGARSTDITGIALRHGMAVCAIGCAVGLALAALGARFMRFLLFGVTPLDPVTFAAVVALVLAVALLANLLPAVRSARVDPLESLRFE